MIEFSVQGSVGSVIRIPEKTSLTRTLVVRETDSGGRVEEKNLTGYALRVVFLDDDDTQLAEIDTVVVSNQTTNLGQAVLTIGGTDITVASDQLCSRMELHLWSGGSIVGSPTDVGARVVELFTRDN